MRNDITNPMRVCKNCLKAAPLTDFYPMKGCKDGRRPICKNCAALEKQPYIDRMNARTEFPAIKEKCCTKCLEVKPISEFARLRRHSTGYNSICKACYKSWRQRPEVSRRINTRRRAQYAVAGREKSTTSYFLRTYGMTADDYNLLLEHQQNRCAICGDEPNEKRLSVDHCHETGRVRGLLCSLCNRALGGFRDDVRFLKNAIHYLERSYA